MSDGSQRLFFALWPSNDVRGQLAKAVAPLTDSGAGRAVPPMNFHITLAFLDQVPDSAYAAIIDAARSVQFPPLAVELDCFGLFERPQVAWLGCSVVPVALTCLADDLRSALTGLVRLRPERSFCPHVSAVRKISALPDLEPPLKVFWQASDFVLVRSEFGPGHATYTVLERFSASFD